MTLFLIVLEKYTFLYKYIYAYCSVTDKLTDKIFIEYIRINKINLSKNELDFYRI